ncbi:hypothetical protein [Pontibacter sp. G13]|uniref:hypothetical protein n=1 Tax=Pontibacter sp. G13 TaxID=3074898 RepID=UPI00288BC4FF|nr:hypothetical protein [Pontibacter sp. G13]WNJ17110.1 hypothetical protein RJD25_19825 [Pontibacter sp. G13]
MNRNIYVLLGLMSVFAWIKCSPPNPTFTDPVILPLAGYDTLPKVTYHRDSAWSNFPPFIGKYSFGDPIDLNDFPAFKDIPDEDYLHEYRDWDPEGYDVRGFDIRVAYDQDLFVPYDFFEPYELVRYFPVFFVNETDSVLVFTGRNNYTFGLQEALSWPDSIARWGLIETPGVEFCGNGGFAIRVHPGEFVTVLMLKYSGSVDTQLRVRFVIGDEEYVSASFPGQVNPQQFMLSNRDRSWINPAYGCDEDWFYGGTPLGY